jgi:hypothetical protein
LPEMLRNDDLRLVFPLLHTSPPTFPAAFIRLVP